jgi:hypothetical protein
MDNLAQQAIEDNNRTIGSVSSRLRTVIRVKAMELP